MPDQPTYRSQVLDHLGLVAGMFDELGIGDVIDQATQQNPEMRDLTTGEAVKAMVLNGLGFINQALYLVPRFFQNKPTYRLISPRVAPDQLNDDALGRALDTLYANGVRALYSLTAATAAERLGLTPRFAHLDSTSFYVDGRYNRDEAPEEQVIHITRGYSRDHRPDLNQVMLELIVEHQAGIPLLMPPLSGNSSDVQEFGQVIRTHIEQLHTTYGVTYIVADSALYSEANLQKLARTAMKWITRVPATLSEAQAALAQVDPQALASLQEGYRYHELTSTYGGIEQRWVLIYSEPRQPQAQRTIDRQLRQQSDAEVKALKKLCSSTFACEADARQALATFEQDLQPTCLRASSVRTTPRDGKRGRPRHGMPPDQLVYQIDGTLASSLVTRQALIAQHSCFILATNELDNTQLPPQEVLAGYKGQGHVERGFRFLKDPQFLASSLYLKKPERIMALLMVMTVCLLVYAALEYRIRKALKDHEATFPDQKGKRIPHPTARWVFHYFVGIHLILWGFTCCVRQANGRWCSISPRNISTCCASLESLTCNFTTSDIRKNHKGGAECPLLTWLSDGEQSFLGRMCLFSLLGATEALILLDEPEVHFNDYWKRQIVYLLDEVLQGRHSHVLMATHSSIVLTDVSSEDIIVLNREGPYTNQAFNPSIRTFAADPNDILAHVFGAPQAAGEQSVTRIQTVLDGLPDLNPDEQRRQLQELLAVVGPGYRSYRIRRALQDIEGG